jgi:leucine dehydrogenase
MFEFMELHQQNELHIRYDEKTGLKAIIAINDTRLGPSLGGCRCLHYDHEDMAILDAIRLAQGMTYKSAFTGLNYGGGKTVIMCPNGDYDRKELFKAYGRFVEDLGGRYITGEDSGTTTDDLRAARGETSHVFGLDPTWIPSPYTALGVRRGIEACVHRYLDRDSLEGLHVAVQGLGHVGYLLCKELKQLGAKLTVTDVDDEKVQIVAKELGATTVAPKDIYDVDCDIFSPCALGGAINDDTISRLKCKIVAGAANNQLALPEKHGLELMNRNILYAPDYAINAGGLICVVYEKEGFSADVARDRVELIYDSIVEVIDRSKNLEKPTSVVADLIAEERLSLVEQV